MPVISAGVKNAAELDFDETDVGALLKRKNYKVYRFFQFKSSIIRLTASISDTIAEKNLVCPNLLPEKWRSCFHPIHNLSHMSPGIRPINTTVKRMLFVHLSNLFKRLYFGVVDIVAVAQLI